MARKIKLNTPIEDLQDELKYYNWGETWPREGLEVTDERFEEVLNAGVGVEVTQEETEAELTEEFNFDALNKTEIKALLDEEGIEYGANDTKDELIAKIKQGE